MEARYATQGVTSHGDQSYYHPLEGDPIEESKIYGLNQQRNCWHLEESNLKPWEEHILRSKTYTTRSTYGGG